MPVVSIVLAGIKGPEAGKKRGRIQSQDGMIFQITPALSNGLQLGHTYSVEYTDEEFRDAKYRVVQSIIPEVAGHKAQPHPPSPAPQMTNSGSLSDASQDKREESIAAQAALKAQGPIAIGDVTAILDALKAGAMAWRLFKRWQKDGNIESGVQPSAPRDEMDDEIPF